MQLWQQLQQPLQQKQQQQQQQLQKQVSTLLLKLTPNFSEQQAGSRQLDYT
ncbi:hypothetical protein HPP92_022110 [Vanilla planifolia]|uniref:Uncharacterized protein n=1 Tax=Vanilla planifolia TaxID=51239 RepID=A0A835PZY2_VANPL|nr:hypothetical protein HPP92_022110 [Vanilla planifolia]